MILFLVCLSVVSGGPNVLRNVLETPSRLSALFFQNMQVNGKQYSSDEVKFRMRVFRLVRLIFYSTKITSDKRCNVMSGKL